MDDSLKERKIIQKLVKQLVGLPKTDIFNILFKTEQLFSIIEDPDAEAISTILYSWDNPNEIQCVDGSFQLLIDYTVNLRIYITTYPTKYLSVFRNNYHFRTAYCNNSKAFTKKNIIQSFRHTSMEAPVRKFLKKNRLRKRNSITNRFLILEYLQRIECR